MKYGNIIFSGKEINNLGDQMQIIAIDQMYDRLKIPNSERISIPLSELDTYSNDKKVIFPVSFPFLKYNPKGICGLFGKSIIPVFIGFTWLNPHLSHEERDYLRTYEPIGCRDEYTRNNLMQNGINAYLNGCITLSAFCDCSFEKNSMSRTKYYLVDVEDSFFPYIPEEIRQNAVIRSQYIRIHSDENIYQIAKERYREYGTEAKLIITSRLHCAIPCISMGIPVIILRQKVSYRFSWVEKLLPIYTMQTIENVEWNPMPIDYEPLVSMQCKNFKKAINGFTSSVYKELDDYLMDRQKSEYYIDGVYPAINYLKSLKNCNRPYILWGGSLAAQCIYDIVKKEYKGMWLIRLIDKYSKIRIGGINSCSYEEVSLEEWKKAIVFVTAYAANKEAESVFAKIEGKVDVVYCYT